MAKTVKSTTPEESFNTLLQINNVKKVLWIPGQVPSLKNSKEIVTIKTKNSICCNAPLIRLSVGNFLCAHCHKPTKHKTRPLLIPSKSVEAYYKTSEAYYASSDFKARYADWFDGCESPIYMGMYFVRKTANAWDFNNVSQIVQDLLVKHNHIVDDNVRYLIPVLLGSHKDAERPGVIIIPLYNFQSTLNNALNDQFDKLSR